VNQAIKRERQQSESIYHVWPFERTLTISIVTAHPAEGVSVKVISGVSDGVEVSRLLPLMTKTNSRDSFDRWEDVGSSISE